MNEKHRIEEIEELAALFALGALPDDDAAHFEQSLEGTDIMIGRSELAANDRVVRLLPFTANELKPPDYLKARLMERIGSKPTPQEAVLVRAGEDGWVQTPVPGVQTKSLYGKKTLLVRMAPKTTLPEHDHNAAEQCLVLEGSVTCDGVTAYAGDYTYIPAGTHHNALYSEEGCLLLIAYTS